MTLRATGLLTLPEGIRKAAHLEEGDVLEAELTDEGILRPQAYRQVAAWYWTPELAGRGAGTRLEARCR